MFCILYILRMKSILEALGWRDLGHHSQNSIQDKDFIRVSLDGVDPEKSDSHTQATCRFMANKSIRQNTIYFVGFTFEIDGKLRT